MTTYQSSVKTENAHEKTDKKQYKRELRLQLIPDWALKKIFLFYLLMLKVFLLHSRCLVAR